MSEIKTNLTVSGESSEYRGNISISVVTLNSNLVDTQSSFRTNIEVSLNIENDTISSIKTDLELNNVSLDFYLVDMTKLKQSILYFSKFFNMNFEPELIWEMLAQGTSEQINASHLSDALSKYVSVDSLTNIYNSITNLGNTINGHINNNIVHLTDEEKYFLNSIMTNPPWSTGTAGLFEYINAGDNNNVIWAVRPLLNAGKDVGIISNTFISCRGVDIAAGGSGGGITRQDLFYILKGEPQDSSEYINSKYLRLDDILDDYATEEWVNNTFIKEEKDPTVPSHVKKITQDQIYSWDLVASLFSVSEDDTYVLVNDNRGFVSTSFLSCKGLDASAANSGSGIDMSLVWYYLGLDGNEQINKSHITTALNGYATEDWVSSNYVLGSTYTNQIQTINTNISKKANKTLTITAGNGLTGGGTLEANRTFTLGTPSTITATTTNEVTSESHTHEIDQASTSVAGIVKLYDALDSDSIILALTAKQGKAIGTRVVALEDMWENKDTYLLAKNNRGIVSNSFISCRGLDETAPQIDGTFDRGSLFDILSSEPQEGESINLSYLDLNTYATIDFVTSQGYINSGALTGYATQQWVLNKGYATTNDLDTRINDLINGAPVAYDTLKEIADVLADNVDSIGDILTALGNKADKATTLAGYGITDALSSTTKYALGDAVGGNAVNANKFGNQLPAYYATADGLTGVSNRVKTLEDVIGIDANGDVYIKKNGETARNFYTYGAISFGGVGQGSGSGIGVTTLAALTDVSLNQPTQGQALIYSGSSWVNQDIQQGLDENALYVYLTDNKYATQSWVLGGNYITEDELNAKKYLTGITSVMVTNALGFTPFDSNLFTEANIKSTLGISDWALGANKPSYKYSEIDETPSSLKNPNALKFGHKSYDGSAEATIAASDLGALTSHQTIHKLSFVAGSFTAGDFTANVAAKTFNIPTTTSHISEGANWYFTNSRAISALTETLKSYVTLANAQTISGVKTFSSGLKLGDITLSQKAQNSTKYIEIDGDLVVTGAISFGGAGQSSGGEGGITQETDPIFTASAAYGITASNITTWNAKQDAISDLATIRSGAALGATAVQPSSLAKVATSGKYSDLSGTPTIPTSLKSPYALTFGSKTYDGSAAKTILASDLGALTAHQTIYALTIKSSAGVAQVTYTPNSAAASLTLAKSMVGLGNVDNTADNAKYVKGVIDCGDTNYTIKIGLRGAGLKASTAKYLAAYGISDDGEYFIKDINKTEAKSWLSLGSLAYRGSLAFSELTDKPTTLSGYGITDALSSSTKYALSNAVGGKALSMYVNKCSSSSNSQLWNDATVYPQTVKFWDVYEDGGPTTYGNILEINGVTNHWKPQLWFDAYTGQMRVRNKSYNSTSFNGWRIVLDSANYTSYTYSQSTINTKLSSYLPLSGGTMTGQIIMEGASVLGVDSGTFYLGSPYYPVALRSNGTTKLNGYDIIHSGNIYSQIVAKADSAQMLNSIAPVNGNHKFLYFSGQPAIGTNTGNAFAGSSNAWNLYSFPTAGTGYNDTVANIQNLRLVWNSEYFQDIFASPNMRGLWYRNVLSGTANLWSRIVLEDTATQTDIWAISISKNAASATKLQSARTLWGRSFDGTGNVTGTLSDVNNIDMTGDLKIGTGSHFMKLNVGNGLMHYVPSGGWARGYDIYTNSGAFMVSVCGAYGTNDNLNYLYYGGSYSAPIMVIYEGNVGIGVTAPAYKLQVSGAIYSSSNIIAGGSITTSGNLSAAGAITFGSDERYKTRIENVSLDLETIANAPLFNYRWTDREDNKVHLGTTAQYWNNTNFRNAVCPTNDKSLWTMSYSEIAMGNTIVLARELIPIKKKISEIDELKSRVKQVEEENKLLKQEIETLKQYRRN